ncbi:uncharacterized protein LOC117909228 [Vitis riparia]|uniref:uncharacterized protein LOC117909228 n=1 Tax=Vitis riparia TaxID=96939 RepID=UPI00155B401A|nr:uncharacterized protein LOC117909228 [Vitis riparia]
MDQIENQKLQALSEFTKSQFLKKVAQLLLSVSVFSFFFSYSTWLSFLSHSFNLSSFPFQLLTHSINRNCIFLLCNGILVFLARNSGLIRSSSSGFDHADEYLIKKTGDRLPMLLDNEATTETTEPPESAADDQEERDKKYFFKEEETENLIEEDEEQEVDHGTSLLEDENPKKSSLESSLFIEEEEHSSLSTEELNKKFDDFIRRMKEEIRIGSMTTSHSLAIKESSSFDQSV